MIPRSTRLWVLLVVVATLLVPLRPASAGDCGLKTLDDGFAHRTPYFSSASTWIYGDSITYQVWRQAEQRFPGASVDAYWGRRTTDVLDRIRQDVPRHTPKTVVVATGTNDRRNPREFGGDVARIRKWLPAKTRLIWVLVYVDTSPNWQEVDARVLSAARVEVVDWVTPNLRARGKSAHSYLLYDGVHMSCEGARTWLDLVAQAVNPVPPVRVPLA